MGKFNLSSLLNNQPQAEEAKPEGKPKKAAFEVVPISVYDIEPSEDNFYSVEQIQELKTAIELAGGIKQNLLVVPMGGGKYKAIAGHRRRLASIALVEEGKTQYEFVPCKIEENEEDAKAQADREELLLILTNSQREKTDWEKMEEVRRLRVVLERYKQKEKVPGRVRDIIAEALKTSAAQVGRLDAISKHLIPEFQGEMKTGRLGLTAAYELSGLPEKQQKQAFAEYREKGGFSISDVKQKKELAAGQEPKTAAGQKTAGAAGQPEPEEPLPGQMYYDGALHDSPPPDEEQPPETPIPPVTATTATPPTQQPENEVEPPAARLEVHPTEQAAAETSKDRLPPTLPDSTEAENGITKQIDAAIEALFAVSAAKGIDGNTFSLIMKALEFYKQEEGWKRE